MTIGDQYDSERHRKAKIQCLSCCFGGRVVQRVRLKKNSVGFNVIEIHVLRLEESPEQTSAVEISGRRAHRLSKPGLVYRALGRSLVRPEIRAQISTVAKILSSKDYIAQKS